MWRRDLLTFIAVSAACAAVTSPLAWAQAPQTRHRIAFVHSGIATSQLTEASETYWIRRFFSELRALGHAEGINLVVERYSAQGHPERFTHLAGEVVSRKPDLIVANQNPLVAALRAATDTIPIVAIVGDPVGFGLVSGLARPGGNITGVSVDAGIEFYGKRVQLLKEAVPAAERVVYLGLGPDWQGAVGQAIRDAANSTKISIVSLAPSEVTPAQLRAAFAEVVGRRVDGLIVSGAGDFLAHRQLIVELAEKGRLAAMYPYRDYVEAGGLLAYAPELGDLARRLAQNAHDILQGAKPADIPIYQASKFELVINLKNAKALDLTVPQSLLARADEVIE